MMPEECVPGVPMASGRSRLSMRLSMTKRCARETGGEPEPVGDLADRDEDGTKTHLRGSEG